MSVFRLVVFLYWSFQYQWIGHGLAAAENKILTIGGIFGPEPDSDAEATFKLIIEETNKNPTFLPNVTLTALINNTQLLDAFKNIEMVQYQVEQGVVGIIGPYTSTSVKYTHPYCAGFHIPQIAPVSTDPNFAFSYTSFPYLLRMSSDDTVQCEALAGVIEHFNWTRMALLSSRDDYGINGLIHFKDIATSKGWKILANEHFNNKGDASAIDVSKQLRTIQQTGTRIIILNCYSRQAVAIMKKAYDINMIKDFAWILTDGSTNANWFDRAGPDVSKFFGVIGTRPAKGQGKLFNDFELKWKNTGRPGSITTVVGKTYDSMLVLLCALNEMQKDGHNITQQPKYFDFTKGASSVSPWEQGKTLLDYIRKVNIDGVMNYLNFSYKGSPGFSGYDIVNLGREDWIKVGDWTRENGVHLDLPVIWLSGSTVTPLDIADTVANRTLTVTAVLEEPFIKIKINAAGETQYEGLCIDLIDRLRRDMKFNYVLHITPGDVYGTKDIYTGNWNGMVKELMDGKADIGIGSFSISSDREATIDFTQPFMDVGLTILMKKTPDDEYKVLSFLRPFTWDLWVALVCAVFVIGIVLWITSIWSPYGFRGRCVQVPDTSKVKKDDVKTIDNLQLVTAVWSSFSYAVSQGSDNLHPVSGSGRIVVGVWWFAALIITASYTANLASFLIVKRFSVPITGVEELARQTNIKYGTVRYSHPHSFFERTSIPTYSTMWEFMKYQETLVNSTEQGIERTRNENYAFIWSNAILEYYTKQKPCDTLTTVGETILISDVKRKDGDLYTFSHKSVRALIYEILHKIGKDSSRTLKLALTFGRFGLGFGLQKDSPFTEQFNVEILKLRQTGFLKTLEEKWLTGFCVSSGYSSSTAELDQDGNQLSFYDLSGVFYTVLAGSCLSILFMILEILWASRADVKSKWIKAPKTIFEALRTRMKRTWDDILGKNSNTKTDLFRRKSYFNSENNMVKENHAVAPAFNGNPQINRFSPSPSLEAVSMSPELNGRTNNINLSKVQRKTLKKLRVLCTSSREV